MTTATLQTIKEQIGLDLVLCDYFEGSEDYFNVILNEKISESKEYIKLERFASQYKTIRIEPNGVRRVAIFPLN